PLEQAIRKALGTRDTPERAQRRCTRRASPQVLVDEARFAHPGGTDQRHGPRLTVAQGALESGVEPTQFGVAADEGRSEVEDGQGGPLSHGTGISPHFPHSLKRTPTLSAA